MKPNLKQFASVFPLILVKPINTCKHTHSSENRSRWWCATQGAHWRGNSEDDHRVQEKFNDGSGWERSSYLWESPDVTHATQARRGAEAQSAQSGAVDCLCVRVCMWQDTWRWQEGQEGPLCWCWPDNGQLRSDVVDKWRKIVSECPTLYVWSGTGHAAETM